MQPKRLALIGLLVVALPASMTIAADRSDGDFNVRNFQVHGDGKTKDTLSLQQALDRCWVFGGGTVTIPAGDYLTGSLQLHGNTTLLLESGAILRGSADLADYPVTQVRWEGKWIQGHRGLLYAADSSHISIKGPGQIIGDPALGGRPNAQDPLRRPALIEPIRCADIHLEGFSTSYVKMWSIHPTCCEGIAIKDLTIRSTGGNGDGIDVDSCRHVTIDHCDISTGDDCIAIKSGRGMEAFRLAQPTEDVSITNCTLADSIFACIGIGSETSGGIRNVRISDCTFTHAKTFAVYIKSRPGRGAFIEDIHATNLTVKEAMNGFLRINLLNSGIQDPEPVPGDEGIPTSRNYSFSKISVSESGTLVDAVSIPPEKPLDGLTLTDITADCRKGILIANTVHAEFHDLHVTGISGPPLSTRNVSGSGLDDAVPLAPPASRPASPATRPSDVR